MTGKLAGQIKLKEEAVADAFSSVHRASNDIAFGVMLKRLVTEREAKRKVDSVVTGVLGEGKTGGETGKGQVHLDRIRLAYDLAKLTPGAYIVELKVFRPNVEDYRMGDAVHIQVTACMDKDDNVLYAASRGLEGLLEGETQQTVERKGE